jgi:hypothetical protein
VCFVAFVPFVGLLFAIFFLRNAYTHHRWFDLLRLLSGQVAHHKLKFLNFLNFLNIVFIIFIFVMFGINGSATLTMNGSTTLTTSKVYDLSPGQGMRPALCGTSLAGTGFRHAKRGTATKTEILTHPWWGEGTTTSPTNRLPISFTLKVRVILVSGGENGQRSQ